MNNVWNGAKWIRRELRAAVYDRDGWRCIYCHANDHLTLDHLKPRVFGGHNKPTNLVTACKPCNTSRGDRPWQEFATNDVISIIKRNRRRSVVNRRAKYKRLLAKMSWNELLTERGISCQNHNGQS